MHITYDIEKYLEHAHNCRLLNKGPQCARPKVTEPLGHNRASESHIANYSSGAAGTPH